MIVQIHILIFLLINFGSWVDKQQVVKINKVYKQKYTDKSQNALFSVRGNGKLFLF